MERRQRRYVIVMGTCVVLILLAWQVVRYFSITAAVILSAIAAFLPPVAVIIGNAGWRDRTGRKHP